MDSVVFVAGARPNFMKIAPLLRAKVARGAPFRDVLVHTGQHYDYEMSGVFFEQLGMREPDLHLQVGSARHGEQTAKLMSSFEDYLVTVDTPPRGVVVVGDVNSTMACAIVAAKMRIPVAHVEAGLRSFDRDMPEEINRVITDAIADLLLVSEPAGMENLTREGVSAARIRYVGNVMIDTLVDQLEAARELAMADRLGMTRSDYALVTLHRPSNVDSCERLTDLVAFLKRLAGTMAVVFPVHPRTEAKLAEFGLRSELEATSQLHLSPSLGYREFLSLMDGAGIVVSDSGGIQEETTYLGIPCVTLRSNTERPVTTTQGTNTLVGDDLSAAWRAVDEVAGGRYKTGGTVRGWDGHAAERIIDVLVEEWM